MWQLRYSPSLEIIFVFFYGTIYLKQLDIHEQDVM